MAHGTYYLNCFLALLYRELWCSLSNKQSTVYLKHKKSFFVVCRSDFRRETYLSVVLVCRFPKHKKSVFIVKFSSWSTELFLLTHLYLLIYRWEWEFHVLLWYILFWVRKWNWLDSAVACNLHAALLFKTHERELLSVRDGKSATGQPRIWFQNKIIWTEHIFNFQ